MYSIASHCMRCGAPIYVPTMWHSISPPPPSFTCSCFPQPTVVTTNNTSVTISPGDVKATTSVVAVSQEEQMEQIKLNQMSRAALELQAAMEKEQVIPTIESLLSKIEQLEKKIKDIESEEEYKPKVIQKSAKKSKKKLLKG